jgi:hypothetical protein
MAEPPDDKLWALAHAERASPKQSDSMLSSSRDVALTPL